MKICKLLLLIVLPFAISGCDSFVSDESIQTAIALTRSALPTASATPSPTPTTTFTPTITASPTLTATQTPIGYDLESNTYDIGEWTFFIDPFGELFIDFSYQLLPSDNPENFSIEPDYSEYLIDCTFLGYSHRYLKENLRGSSTVTLYTAEDTTYLGEQDKCFLEKVKLDILNIILDEVVYSIVIPVQLTLSEQIDASLSIFDISNFIYSSRENDPSYFNGGTLLKFDFDYILLQEIPRNDYHFVAMPQSGDCEWVFPAEFIEQLYVDNDHYIITALVENSPCMIEEIAVLLVHEDSGRVLDDFVLDLILEVEE